MKVTLTDDNCHKRRSKVTKLNYWSYLANYYTHWHHAWYQGTIQWATSNDISLFDLDLRSRSQLMVKGHRRGDVCVLWMLLLFFFGWYIAWFTQFFSKAVAWFTFRFLKDEFIIVSSVSTFTPVSKQPSFKSFLIKNLIQPIFPIFSLYDKLNLSTYQNLVCLSLLFHQV